MNTDQLIKDLKAMIQADTQHLAKAVAQGDRTEAHALVDAIINHRRELEDLTR